LAADIFSARELVGGAGFGGKRSIPSGFSRGDGCFRPVGEDSGDDGGRRPPDGASDGFGVAADRPASACVDPGADVASGRAVCGGVGGTWGEAGRAVGRG
jgi:hypothetical protein